MPEIRLVKGEATVRQRRFEQGPVRIGRDPECEVSLSADPEVSRRHARLERAASGWTITDEGSANGTYVNQNRLAAGESAALSPGDRVCLGPSGDTELIYGLGADPLAAGLLLAGDSFHERLLAGLLGGSDPVALARARDRLYVLYEASRAVFSRILDFRDLLDRIKEEVVRALNVDEMIVALKEPDGGVSFEVVNRRDRFRSTEIAGSRSLIARVLESGEAVWLDPDQASARSGSAGSTSFVRHHIRTVMCVPLVFRNQVLGAIYVQNPEGRDATFSPADFDFLTAFAAQAGVAIQAARGAEERGRQLEQMRRENVELREGIDTRDPLRAILGESPAIRAVKKLIEAVKDLPSTVLVVGESGTGKELVAKALHYGGVRREKPFVSVSVAAFAGGVLESELFGHERGAFTGAVGRKLGRFELARDGTLFLDEIGEIQPAVQVKLLRVLQERSFERVGGSQPVEVDVRLVFATNRDLQEAMRRGEFREDLYYRIAVVPLSLPPLRERREDIPIIAEGLMARLRQKLGIEAHGLTPAAEKALLSYDYPGNVRELENILERTFIRLKIRGGDRVEQDDLPADLRGDSGDRAPGRLDLPDDYAGLRAVEKQMVLRALRRTGWNKRRAAQLLGVTHQTLYSRIAEFELKEDE